MVQGPPGPPAQLGQDGRDGQDGQMPQVPRGIINVPGVAHAPLDTTGLENSFENLGRTMVDVLTIQQQTNLTLQIRSEGPMMLKWNRLWQCMILQT